MGLARRLRRVFLMPAESTSMKARHVMTQIPLVDTTTMVTLFQRTHWPTLGMPPNLGGMHAVVAKLPLGKVRTLLAVPLWSMTAREPVLAVPCFPQLSPSDELATQTAKTCATRNMSREDQRAVRHAAVMAHSVLHHLLRSDFDQLSFSLFIFAL